MMIEIGSYCELLLLIKNTFEIFGPLAGSLEPRFSVPAAAIKITVKIVIKF